MKITHLILIIILLIGRPYGECAIVWNSNIKYKISPVECDSPRIFAINIEIQNNINLLLCNIYMPYDERFAGKNLDIYNDTLNEVSQLRHKLNPTYFILSGDFNTDLARKSPHTEAFIYFMKAEQCTIPKNNIIFTYFYKDCLHRSKIDHFVVNDGFKEFIKSCDVYCDNTENMSDHIPVKCDIDVPVELYQKKYS